MRKFKIPNRLINDMALSFSARRLGAYFCAVSNRLGVARKSLAMLSGLSGLSVSTVQSAIDELERGGYLTRQKTYRYDTARMRLIYDKTAYQIQKHLSGGFTLVPAALLRERGLASSAFVLALYLCQQGADQGRAFPSIRQMSDAIGIAKSTVCRALQQLKAVAVFLVRHCVRKNHTFAANSYFYLHKSVCQGSPSLALAVHKLYSGIRHLINQLGCPKISKPVIRLR